MVNWMVAQAIRFAQFDLINPFPRIDVFSELDESASTTESLSKNALYCVEVSGYQLEQINVTEALVEVWVRALDIREQKKFIQNIKRWMVKQPFNDLTIIVDDENSTELGIRKFKFVNGWVETTQGAIELKGYSGTWGVVDLRVRYADDEIEYV